MRDGWFTRLRMLSWARGWSSYAPVETFRTEGCSVSPQAYIWYKICMKTITINVSEPVYREFQERARKVDRTASELIREAMEYYVRERLRESRSVLEFPALDLGKVKKPLSPKDDLLAEMTRDVRR